MLGYLGPRGTFTQQALLTFYTGEAVGYDTVLRALDAVRTGEVEAALVPIENSVEGGVTTTLDSLASGKPLMIIREAVLPVHFNLCGRPGAKIEQVRRVLSHPHAIAQVREWLAANLSHASVTEGGSTAAAAKEVSDPTSKYDAAICARVAQDNYGLVPLAENIADNSAAVTRFVLVSKPVSPPPPTGADKTTLVAFMRADRPGALLEILEQFSGRGVNLCRIESRPTKTGLGNYCFSIDLEGHMRDPRVAEAMLGLRRVCADVVFLGSYARADGVAPSVGPGFTDAEFAEARQWYTALINPSDD
ncbi:MAG: prephenate dehydratase [Propionibacteriaceae bacterium]|nr:prephenate dehydratase [Propionibacteriaceae bacterium]